MYKSLISSRKSRTSGSKNDTPFADDEQTYGFVEQMLGNGRATVICSDGTKLIGRICGSMRKHKKGSFVERSDIVLCCTRDFDKTVVDIVYKYTLEEVRLLERNGLLSDVLLTSLYGDKVEEGQEIEFTDDADDIDKI